MTTQWLSNDEALLENSVPVMIYNIVSSRSWDHVLVKYHNVIYNPFGKVRMILFAHGQRR